MFDDVLKGDRVKVYVQGGADFTGIYMGPVPGLSVDRACVQVRASNDKPIRILLESVVAVVAL